MSEPFESESDLGVAPSSMTLRAVNWATFPEPEIATSVEGLLREYSGHECAIICKNLNPASERILLIGRGR